MNPNEQNKAIAEYCGWHDIEVELERFGIEDLPNGQLRGITPKGNSCVLPNYCEDLNAMHEAEKMFNAVDQTIYAEFISAVVNNNVVNWGYYPGDGTIDWNGLFTHIHATSQQRAEAFLRTIGKWKE
jgi:hypothetical protein